ncbi:hypothetical protein SAMN04487968_12015 [Nocardioides terrae]|uniref:MJ0042 family finger-like domain-containing protein n=1 Tax=Nocardioides terrae TaxID=574651 RepID=A0A1I1NT20_9ACTN|nr:DUF6510 family protein [Nocardioides terrae]SFD00575.1 hypothetical protein SAMN04487968_12015 [Nocardioides terrae]
MTTEVSSPSTPGDDAGSGLVLDGNAAAGEFSDVLAHDPTTVTVRCGTCSATQAFAQLRAYLGGPGTVLRCRECEAIVARLARTPRGTWLDISGSSSWLFLPRPARA